MEYAIEKNTISIKLIQDLYLSSDSPWYIGFSGGKDSSAVLKLVFLALLDLDSRPKPVTILYCDTGVEIPVFRDLVINTLNSIEFESTKHNIPINVNIVSPSLKNRFFSKVIGRGYPPPTNKFRWCTDKLRIIPINSIIGKKNNLEKIILLGIRNGESTERDRTMLKHSTTKEYLFSQSGNASTLIFSPVYNYSIEDIWETIVFNKLPKSIDTSQLASLYRKANGECPLIRDPKSIPCGKGRFGCWVCTVVRKDVSVKGLISEGYTKLLPLYDFRNWLLSIRDNPYYRWSVRRNGQIGFGPFTLSARFEILNKLLHAQAESGYSLIDDSELAFIYDCWDSDAIQ